jgi:hypothetical protein
MQESSGTQLPRTTMPPAADGERMIPTRITVGGRVAEVAGRTAPWCDSFTRRHPAPMMASPAALLIRVLGHVPGNLDLLLYDQRVA